MSGLTATINPAVATRRFFIYYFGALLLWAGTTAMHIPDGYLSPATSLFMFLLTLPFWAAGMRRLRGETAVQTMPLVALLSAFSFVVMMFNVPLPGGTSGHAVGGALAAIVLGPELATIAVSIALIIQALFFGDGGILAIGANCFNIAVVVPYVSVAVYRTIGRGAPLGSARRLAGAALGGWLGLTAAALLTGVELGLQPLLFRNPDGTPLYAPYSPAIAIPAMVLPHALVASVVEGLLTALTLAYLRRASPRILEEAGATSQMEALTGPRRHAWLIVLLIVLIIASPLGLLAPGTAWGEWGTEELTKRGLQSIPAGLQQLSGLWGAPLSGYRISALGNASLGYLLSALVGVLLIGILAWLFTALLTVRSRPPAQPTQPASDSKET